MMKGAVTALSALVIFSCLIVAYGIEDKKVLRIHARISGANKDAVYKFQADKVPTLGEIFGADVKLTIANKEDSALEGVTYKLYWNDYCMVDETAKVIEIEKLVPEPPMTANVETSVIPLDAATANFSGFCGPVCIFANVTKDNYINGIARVGLYLECDNEETDLELVSEIPKAQTPYLLKHGQPLHEVITGFNTVKLKNVGGKDMVRKGRDVKDSVLAFIRIDVITQEEILESVDADYCNYWSTTTQATSSSTSPYSTSTSTTSTTTMTSEEPDYEDEGLTKIMQGFEEWNMEREEMQIDKSKIPKCTYASMLRGDVPLVGGDILLQETVKAGEESSRLKLDNVTFETAGTKICSMWNEPDSNGYFHANVYLLVDPLGMYNDSDLCNNYLSFEVKYTCEDKEETIYDESQCEVRVNPMSRGHKASVYMNGERFLNIDGDSVEMEDDLECKSFEDEVEEAEMNRWKLLADRYQREAERNPKLCMEVDTEAAGRDAELLDKGDTKEQVARKKRQLGPEGGTEADGNGGEKPNLREMLESVQNGHEDALKSKELALKLLCLQRPIVQMVNDMEVELDQDMDALYEDVVKKWDELRSTLELIGDPECPNDGGDNGDDANEVLEKAIADKDDSAAESIQDAKDQNDQDKLDREAANDGSTEEKINYIMEKSDEEGCPGARGGSSEGNLEKADQIISLSEKSADVKSGEMERGPIPNTTCGVRRVQQTLSRTAGKLFNKDIKWAKRPFTRQDVDTNRKKYIKKLYHALEENADGDVETVMEKVKNDMETDVDEKINTCGTGRDQMIEHQGKVDETYDIFWDARKDGMIFRGVADIANSTFGNGDEKRTILWKPIATCFCSHCEYSTRPSRASKDRYGFGMEERHTMSYPRTTTTPYEIKSFA